MSITRPIIAAWSGANDDNGSEFYTLRVRDTDTGGDLEDLVPGTGGSGTWDANE